MELLPGVSDIIQAIERGLTGQNEPFHDDFIFGFLSVGNNRCGTPPDGQS